uniref:Serine-threonine/tyrosine-protein kinase catalytic domain-containing protein n=1 Tax=Lactuca sativa TaxID=4236 RepID=A0A9R1X263_LACSA|nr:hypothetical protein LSAT_V11C700386010 [Lactuca sativa]
MEWNLEFRSRYSVRICEPNTSWNLHEGNRELELVDEELSEFDENEVKRVIKVALLCTQTSPTSRPSMSRVMAMISGDIEASGDITRPEYLMRLKFDDAAIFKSSVQNSVSDGVTGTSNSTVSPCTPNDISRPMLSEFIGEGR